jgi:hypothetical protein
LCRVRPVTPTGDSTRIAPTACRAPIPHASGHIRGTLSGVHERNRNDGPGTRPGLAVFRCIA